MIYKQFDSHFYHQLGSTHFVDQFTIFISKSVKFQSEKMSAFKKLQEANETKPYYGFSKLALGHHKIICFRLVKNKFAKKDECKKSVLIELKDQIIFLPKHFSEKINEDDIIDLNSDGEIKYLYFGGKQENK